MQREVIGWSCNDATGMNPHVPIGGNGPHGGGRGIFYIFNSISGISDFSNRILSWHDKTSNEKTGHERFFKSLVARMFLELKMRGAKILRFSFKRFALTLFPLT